MQPIVIDKDNVVVIGHCRLAAAKKLKLKTVQCVCVEDLTPEQVNALRILDNKTNESEWDYNILIQELNNVDLSGFDIDFDGIEDLVIPTLEDVKEDEVPEVDHSKPPLTQYGDIYQLGDHRLMCGDSTNHEDVAKLVGGEKMDLFLTDPPYNVDYEGTAGKIENDNMEDSKFLAFLTDAFSTANDVLKEGGAFYIWHADSEGYNFRKACKNIGWQIKECLIWNKSSLVLGRQDYQWKHEPCLYGWKDGAAHYFVDDRTLTTVIDDTKQPEDLKKSELLEIVRTIYDHIQTTVLDEKKPNINKLHPTMKPVGLIGRQINNSTQPYEKVLDLFGGSGTTIIACEQLKRKCYTMELDPKYCDVIVQRWEDLTGEKAVRL